MVDPYFTKQFGRDLDRLGYRVTRNVDPSALSGLQTALADIADGECEIVLDSDARAFVAAMFERASGRHLRAPDFEEVVQGSVWLPDPNDANSAAKSVDNMGGDVSPIGLLPLGETKTGETWLLDVGRKAGYVYVVNEHHELLPIFKGIAQFAEWACVNELWKQHRAKEGEVPRRLEKLRFFKSISFLREAGLIPQNFRPKLFKPAHPLPSYLAGLPDDANA